MSDIISCDDHCYRGPKPCPGCVEAEHPSCVGEDKKDDGNNRFYPDCVPAFPFAATDNSNVHLQATGMTLRQWFAGQVVNGMYANSNFNADISYAEIALIAYTQADAMIEAGKQ
jgi:hypothetical protein